MYKSLKFLTFGVLLFLASCKEDDKADLIITNANIYAVDTVYTVATAIAIKDGLILQIGSDEDIKLLANEDTKTIDAQGQFIMPGFIEGHGHYSGLGYSLINLNFLTAKSWEDIVASVAKRAQEVKSGDWIIGRGWHQEKWDSIPKQNVYKYPFHYSLSEVSPDNPVILYHASEQLIRSLDNITKSATFPGRIDPLK